MANEPGGSEALSAESDVLAFFYRDAVGALSRVRDDAARLAEFAARLDRLVLSTGIAATSVHRAEFHRACQLADRVGALTYRLIATLEAVE